jgi:hypothetical protein
VAALAPTPVFAVVDQPVFEAVEPETAPANDVVEFTLGT